jgi:hypothetical protein
LTIEKSIVSDGASSFQAECLKNKRAVSDY